MANDSDTRGAFDGQHGRAPSAKTPEAKLIAVTGSGLSGPFIRRPVMTVLLTLSAIVAGLATYGKLAVNDLPAVDYPVINVTCSYPGANPTTMANNIATPLEKQFLQIPGLDIITSASTQSNTSFTLQFNLSKSITDAATDVQAAIQRATGKLPVDLPSPPTFTKTNPNDQAIYLIGLLSDTLTDGDLYKYASTAVQQRIAILPGVSQVNVYGVQGAIRIKADPAALASRGLTMDDLATAIRAGTVYSGAGQFDGPHRTFVLLPNGQIDQAEGYRNLIVARFFCATWLMSSRVCKTSGSRVPSGPAASILPVQSSSSPCRGRRARMPSRSQNLSRRCFQSYVRACRARSRCCRYLTGRRASSLPSRTCNGLSSSRSCSWCS